MKLLEFLVEWISTGFIILGVALTAWNVYPTNLYVSVIGNLGWIVIGIWWRKPSILLIQTTISGIYLVRFFQMWWEWTFAVH